MKYLFKLGHQPEISKAEIFSLIQMQDKWCGVASENKDRLILTSEQIEPKKLMQRLGGTIYIGEEIDPKGEDLQEQIVNYLSENSNDTKIDFAVTGEGAEEMLMPIKNNLQKSGRSARFVKLENTASIKYNNLVEQGSHINIVDDELYVTKAIQPFEQMKRHGRDRPKADPKSGMLPPKLARIMLNLAKVQPGENLLDPFCGSGTILMEAVSIGLDEVTGNDKEQKAVNSSRENLEWL
ncbi:MAG: RsmD family RNA methyltransferase, partial [Candidatus Magasanikbacteria bacterium]